MIPLEECWRSPDLGVWGKLLEVKAVALQIFITLS